jgi:hypothetical protein
MVGAAGLASSFAGFGPPAARASASASSSSFSDGEPPLVRRVSLTPDTPARGAFQHCALFKNILVAADGDASARLHVLDVRDWSEKQTIRVGAVSPARDENADDVSADDVSETVPAAVSALAFDGTTIVAATHEGFVHTWRLMARGQKRGYVRLLQPLRVDGVAVTAARILGEPGSKLLACHARSKRAFVVWELDTGKLRGAFNTDGVARGAPLLLVESCATVLACVHADAPAEEEGVLEKTKNETETETRNAPSRVVAALLDVRTGEGGALRDSAVLANEGTPSCSAFDGELFVVATSLGFLVAWNLHTGDAPETNAHRGARENARAAVAAVALVPGAGDAPARVLSGGADRALMLWDKALRPLARLELGSPVTCLAAPGPRLAVAGTQDGFVEVVALGPPEDAEPDAALAEAGKKNANASSSNLPRYALRHDPGSAASSYASFDAFTRRVPVWEGAYVAGGETGVSGGTRERNANENASGFSPARALAGSGRSAEEEAARQKREEDEARAKQRAMDGAGVARNPDVRATADGARTCSSPTCVAREDALAPGRKMLRCSRCKRATYCSTHCQRTHWRDGHKRACVAPARDAPSAANEAPAPNAAEPKGASTGAAAGSTGCEASVSTETRAPPPPPPPPPAPARRALVVESESDESDESDASDASDSEAEADVVARGRDVGAGASFASETSGLEVSSLALNATGDVSGDVSDDAAPAHPPWMTAHAPPGVGNVEAGPRLVTEAPPAARAMAVERGASVESRETLAAGSEASGLEPLDEHDLLYELD